MSNELIKAMAADLMKRRNGLSLRRYEHLLACAIRKLFWQATGRQATGETEIAEWMATQEWSAGLDPFAILTEEEIAQFDESIRQRRADQSDD